MIASPELSTKVGFQIEALGHCFPSVPLEDLEEVPFFVGPSLFGALWWVVVVWSELFHPYWPPLTLYPSFSSFRWRH